ncbi:hypothetical protein LTR84_013100 [Exophiala bonariae]|uniref:Uncharacterized protein n=1 Tax=Exophiala bonariae TaxID=1690606 RepID=A0AAV9NHG5_9EURO|nr:hypothetical protein LTR84_013100 [Exophiala bonariae]
MAGVKCFATKPENMAMAMAIELLRGTEETTFLLLTPPIPTRAPGNGWNGGGGPRLRFMELADEIRRIGIKKGTDTLSRDQLDNPDPEESDVMQGMKWSAYMMERDDGDQTKTKRSVEAERTWNPHPHRFLAHEPFDLAGPMAGKPILICVNTKSRSFVRTPNRTTEELQELSTQGNKYDAYGKRGQYRT